MPSVSPTPQPPTPGLLVESIGTDTAYVRIDPVFGGLLKVELIQNCGPSQAMEGAVAAVTVYGDGRIEYHPAPATGGLS